MDEDSMEELPMMQEYKDIRIGDHVKHEDVYVDDRRSISGEGEVIGFGVFGNKQLIWVEGTNGLKAIHYEEIRKKHHPVNVSQRNRLT